MTPGGLGDKRDVQVSGAGKTMDIISQFLRHYRHKFDYYNELARLCAEECRRALEEQGIKGIVSYRAKRPDRVEKKLRKKMSEADFDPGEDVGDLILDLAGVRVALYYPGDRAEVARLIQNVFDKHREPRTFPPSRSKKYVKRFDGYSATHYFVKLKKGTLAPGQDRYRDEPVEIQVASVLMHAWSEVEHDLVYKPEETIPSEAELDILHELNGLVHSGEIALERLQKAIGVRARETGTPFADHFELASYLYTALRPLIESLPENPVMGRIDILFRLLKECGLTTPADIDQFVTPLDEYTEDRPIVHQIIDQILTQQPYIQEVYDRILDDMLEKESYELETHKKLHPDFEQQLRHFISRWGCLEKIIRKLCQRMDMNAHPSMSLLLKILHDRKVFDSSTSRKVLEFSHLRNVVVHRTAIPNPITLESASKGLGQMLGNMLSHPMEEVRIVAEEVLQNERCRLEQSS
jgi:ppGpp synthetase/RelA/SpoT-type nucleotidyltranferase